MSLALFAQQPNDPRAQLAGGNKTLYSTVVGQGYRKKKEENGSAESIFKNKKKKKTSLKI